MSKWLALAEVRSTAQLRYFTEWHTCFLVQTGRIAVPFTPSLFGVPTLLQTKFTRVKAVRPDPQIHSLPEVIDWTCRLSLPKVFLTRGCSPWRLDAAIGMENYTFSIRFGNRTPLKPQMCFYKNSVPIFRWSDSSDTITYKEKNNSYLVPSSKTKFKCIATLWPNLHTRPTFLGECHTQQCPCVAFYICRGQYWAKKKMKKPLASPSLIFNGSHVPLFNITHC